MAQTVCASTSETKLRKEISDITKCSICTEILRDPRMLPCLHNFCLGCLISYEKSKQVGEPLNCPLCRKSIPSTTGGLKSLPINHFINKIIDLNTMQSAEAGVVLCEVCSRIEKKDSAAGYCMECREHLCNGCIKLHGVQTATKTHKTVSLEDKPEATELMKTSVNQCYKHQDEAIKFYCYNCKKTVCVVCYVSEHKEHNCTDISQAAVNLSQRIDGNRKKMGQHKIEARETLRQVKLSKESSTIKGKEVRYSLTAKYNQLKAQLDEQFKQSMDKANEMEINREKELDAIADECEFELVAIADLNTFWEELKRKGTQCDISEAADGILTRGIELLSMHETRISDWKRRSDIRSFDFKFLPSKPPQESLIGELSTGKPWPETEPGSYTASIIGEPPSTGRPCPESPPGSYRPTADIEGGFEQFLFGLTADIHQTGQDICGMAISGSYLFTITPFGTCVYVYNLNHHDTRPEIIRLPNQGETLDIVCCNSNRYIYVSSCCPDSRGYIHRVSIKRFEQDKLKISELWKNWEVSMGKPVSLSLTQSGTILVSVVSVNSIDQHLVFGRSKYCAGQHREDCRCYEKSNAIRFAIKKLQFELKPKVSSSQGQHLEDNTNKNCCILEYNYDGILIRQIQLNQVIDHAVELSSGIFAVCSSLPTLSLSIIDASGTTVSFFKTKDSGQVSQDTSICNPSRILVDQRQNILVVDPQRNELRLFNANLEYLGSVCYFTRIETWISNQNRLQEQQFSDGFHVVNPKQLLYSGISQDRQQTVQTCVNPVTWDEQKKRLYISTRDGTVVNIVPSI